MIEINLLPPQNQQTRQEAQLRYRILVVLGAVSLVVAIDLGLYLPLERVWKSDVANYVAQREQLLNGLDSVSKLAVDLRQVQDKVAGVEAVRNLRVDLAAPLSEVVNLAGNDIEVADMSVDTSGAVVFGAKLGTVTTLNQFIARLDAAQAKFSGMFMKGLSQSAGGYTFRVDGKYENKH